jgi:hypothetical protein
LDGRRRRERLRAVIDEVVGRDAGEFLREEGSEEEEEEWSGGVVE